MNEAKPTGILQAPLRLPTRPGGAATPLAAERIVGLQPMRAVEIEAGEASRLRYYAGRTLSDAALETEQAHRARRLALRGQMASSGVVAGLEVGLEHTETADAVLGAGVFLHLLPGQGLSADGEDVNVQRPLRVALRDLPVFATAALLEEFDRARNGPVAAPEGAAGDAEMDRPLEPGVLQVRRLGPRLGDLLDAGSFPPRAGVLVLQPVTLDVVGDANPADPCALDPQNMAFEDWQRVDACRLVWYAWPEEWVPLPDEGPQWRNLLAHTIFRVELGQEPGDLMPWEAVGVPVALLAFDAGWNALFADRHAVARDGGRPRPRTLLVPDRGDAFLWQARIQQFNSQLAEQVAAQAAGAEPGAAFAPLADALRYAPPVGFLPANAAAVRAGQQFAFPAAYTVQALPVPLEQLDAAIEQSAPLAPLDLAEADVVHLLVPVPQIWFEPHLLRVEQVDPAFQQAIDELVVRRGRWLARRDQVRSHSAALRRALEGTGVADASIVLEGRLFGRIRLDVHAGPSTDEPAVGIATATFSVIGRNEDAGWLLARFAGFTGWIPAGPVTVAGNVADLPVGGPAAPLPPDAFPAPDPGALEDEELAEPVVEGDPVFGTAEAEFGTEEVEGVRVVPALGELVTFLQQETPLAAGEVDRLADLGLAGFIAFLERKLDDTNDHIDFGFLRAQTGIYRLRRQMLGTLDASRLATSPVLAAIAREESALSTKEGLRTYLNTLKGVPGAPGAPAPAGDAAPEGGPAPAGAPEPLSAGAFVAGAGGLTASGPRMTLGTRAGSVLTGSTLAGSVLTGSLLTGVSGTTLVGVTPITGIGGIAGTVGTQFGGGVVDISGAVATRPGVGAVATEAGRGGLFSDVAVTPEVIVQQPPIIGATYEFRTTTVAERIKQPEANEVKATAVAAKFDTFREIVNLGINVDDLEVSVPNADGVQVRRPLGEVKGNLDVLLRDPDPVNGDEAAFFSATVDRLEHTINLLRRVEGRVQEYRSAIARCRTTLEAVTGGLDGANRRLAFLGEKLAEARHDVAVARALLAEETARTNGINARRDKIIAEQVKFLVFRRPRATSARLGAPVRVLDAGLRPAALPACRAAAPSVPPELRRLVSLLREAPVRWFKRLPPILAELRDLDTMRRTVLEAGVRAQFQVQALAAASAAQAALQPSAQVAARTPALALALGKVEDTRRDRLLQVRLGAQQATQQAVLPEAASWRQLYDRGLDLVSVADLIEGRHGRSDLAQAAARRLDEIAQVAACLYAQMGQTPARLRLLWAERLSQFDAPLNLRALTVLPGWGDDDLDRTARRDMQELADWLFDAVDDFQADAVEIMNDVVRSCILLASHAPVNRIVAGRVRAAATVQVGSLVNVAVNVGAVSVGAAALIYAGGQVVAEAVVEDLAAGQAVTRIIRATAPLVQVDSDATVQFTATQFTTAQFAAGQRTLLA